MVSVDLFLKLPALKELRILAGHKGLDNEIRTISVCDAPDSYKWLRGREMILTSGYLVGGDASLLEHFVLNLVEMGASGLGVKKERFFKTIPENVIETADRLGFPLIEIPYHFVWSDIFAVFYELLYTIAENTNIPIKPDDIEQIYNAARWGSGQLMDKLTQLFQIPLAVVLNNKKVIADNGLPGVNTIIGVLEESALFPENMTGEIVAEGKYFIIVCPVTFARPGQMEYLAIMSRSGVFVKELQRLFKLFAGLGEQNNLITMDRSRIYRKFILDFLSGKITREDINTFEEFRGGEVVYTGVMIIKDDESSEIYNHLADILKTARMAKMGKVNSHMVDNAAKGEAVVMMELYIKDLEDTPEIWQHILFEDLEYYMQESRSGFVSMGRMYSGLNDITSAYREAMEALTIGQVLWEDRRCFLYSTVSVYNILRKSDMSEIDMSFMQLLENNQAGFSFDGIQTLEAFIERGGYKKAAADLFIHENTLRYRIQKISDLLHLDMEDPIVLHSLITRVKLWKLMKTGEAN